MVFFPPVILSLGEIQTCGTQPFGGHNQFCAVCSSQNQLPSIEALKSRLNAKRACIVDPTEYLFLPE